MPINIQLRRATASNWLAQNPVLANSELVVETNTRKIKIGDGSTPWNSIPYAGTLGPAGLNGAPNSATGTLAYFPTATAPTGWLRADGSNISSAAYPALSALLQNTKNQLATPTSIDVNFAFGATWVPNTTIFGTYVDYDLIGSGEYLSNYVASGQEFTAFNFAFDQPVVLSALTILNVNYGIKPDYWRLMSGNDIIAETPTNSSFLFVGGVQSFDNATNSFIPNWYTFNNTLARQNYTLIVAHRANYTVDLGISRILLQEVVEAPSGFKILPTLPAKSAGLTNLYPYIKT
jgi:hypothetical protein